MFTGLIRHLGSLANRSSRPTGARLRIQAPRDLLLHTEPGASLCVNGACLTAVLVDGEAFEADLSGETLLRTTFGAMPLRTRLHLEPALRVGDPLDGHLLSGHVDAVGALLERPREEGLWRFGMPGLLAPLVAPKGSVAVDGISLTVADCGRDWFTVALIPETVRATALADLRPGALVNLEGDPIGRFVARALALGDGSVRLARFAAEGWDG